MVEANEEGKQVEQEYPCADAQTQRTYAESADACQNG